MFQGAQMQGDQGPIMAFLSWWWREIGAVAPAGHRVRAAPQIVEMEGDEAVVRSAQGKKGKALRRVRLTDFQPRFEDLRELPSSGPDLRLPLSEVLVRRFTLPRSAEGQIDAILRHEFSARMPYAIEDAYFDHRILRRDRDSIEVELFCVERRRLDDMRALLASAGLSPQAARVGDLDVDLLRPIRGSRTNLWVSLNLVLLAIATALLAANLWYAVSMRQGELDALEAEVAKARAAAEETSALEQKAQRIGEQRRVVEEELANAARRVAILNELTQTLPDQAWLTAFEIKGRSLRIAGQAQSAAALIEILGRSKVFEDPEFTGSVVPTRDGDAERFEIVAKLAEETTK